MKMKTRTTLLSFLLIAFLMHLPLAGEAQSISRGKKKPTTTTMTKKKSQTSQKQTRSKTKSTANVINVSSTKQFLDALGNNKTIVIQKSINLSSILDRELTLTNYRNLTIKGSAPSVKLVVSNGDNPVLIFDSCENISINNLVLGHEGENLDCGASVLDFNKCKGITISSCDIYGCGHLGIVVWSSEDLVCINSNIHDCEWNMLDVLNSNNIKFINTILKDSDSGEIVRVTSSNCVQFDNCSFIQNNKGRGCFGLNCDISLDNCTIRTSNELGDTQFIKQSGCKWY